MMLMMMIYTKTKRALKNITFLIFLKKKYERLRGKITYVHMYVHYFLLFLKAYTLAI